MDANGNGPLNGQRCCGCHPAHSGGGIDEKRLILEVLLNIEKDLREALSTLKRCRVSEVK